MRNKRGSRAIWRAKRVKVAETPEAYHHEHISSSSDSIAFVKRHLGAYFDSCLAEEFHVICLDTKNRVTSIHLITVGTLDASLVHPREVFRCALLDSASSIILTHNHPSGDATPSREDKSVTTRLSESGKVIGIDVLDHIVYGSQEHAISIQEVM